MESNMIMNSVDMSSSLVSSVTAMTNMAMASDSMVSGTMSGASVSSSLAMANTMVMPSSSTIMATSSMAMTMASSMASSMTSSTSSMDMSSGSAMTMQMYMSTTYKNAPVFFKTLHASTGAAAFGIFCVLFFAAFFFRSLIFLSAYVEQKVFHNLTNASIIIEHDGVLDAKQTDLSSESSNTSSLSKTSILKQLFWMNKQEFVRDLVRLVICFTIVIFGYALMLASMSFVLLYFFAICLGLAFAEVFYNKLSILLNVSKAGIACGTLH